MAAITPSDSDREKAGSINDAPPTAVHSDYPPGYDGTQVMGSPEGEIIDYKTLTWWYVTIYEAPTPRTEMLTR